MVAGDFGIIRTVMTIEKRLLIGLVVALVAGSASGAGADTASWPFTFAGNYAVSDATKVEVADGVAKLIAVDQTDDDGTSTGFGGGTHNGTQWDGSNSWLEVDGTSNVWELPDSASSSGWTDMTGNVLLMHMNESSGTVADFSGEGNDGTAYGGITFGANGKLNTALQFDGLDAYVDVGTGCLVSNSWTVSFWLYPSSPDNYERVFIQGFGGCGSRQIMVYWHSGHLEARTATDGSNGNPQEVTGAIANSAWSHFVWTYDGATHILYVNGKPSSGTATGSGAGIAGNNYIGCRDGTSNYWTGRIDEVTVYDNRCLSAGEIKAIYDRQAPDYLGYFDSRVITAGATAAWNSISWTPQRPLYKELPNSKVFESAYPTGNTDMSGNMLLLHMNESSGTVADFSGEGNDGTAYGGVTYEATGRFNTALTFDGTDDYLDCGNNASLDMVSAITIEAWVKGSGAGFSTTQITTSSASKIEPQFQVAGSKIYYVWKESDGSDYQIWTGEMNTDGTGFASAKRTTSGYDKYEPQLQVVGSKIYYVWRQKASGNRYQIWTAEMNTDGTGWSATERTTSNSGKFTPQLQVVGSKIYYVWREDEIWTAEMDTDGTNWSAAERTSSGGFIYVPQLQVVGSKIYYVWGDNGIWTAEMNTDGTGWSATQRTSTGIGTYANQLQVVGTKIYYVWQETSASVYQIWTAEMNTDGTGWSATERTTGTDNNYQCQLQVVGDKIYYIWHRYQESRYQIWTGEMNTDGTDFSATQRTTAVSDKLQPQLQVVGAKIYYVYRGPGGGYWQITTTDMNSNILNKGDFYGLGIAGDTIRGFINAGTDGFKYKAEAISYTAGATVESAKDSDWSHAVVTYDQSMLRLYVNGALIDSTVFTQAINTNSFSLVIGDDFDGTIDEAALYSRILSATEILDHYKRGALRLKYQVRSGSTNPPTGDFIGPDGTTGSYYSELSNGTTGLPSLSLTNVGNNQYFQYKAYLETDTSSYTPELKSVVIGPTHYPGDNPTVRIVDNAGQPYDSLDSFVETLGGGNAGSVKYQISKDGANWYYWNGSNWVSASGYSQTNTAAEVNTNCGQFDDDVGTGDFYFKAFLHSDLAAQQVESDQVDLGYTPLAKSVWVSNSTFAFGANPLDTWLIPQTTIIKNDGTQVENFVGAISQLADGGNTWGINPSDNGDDTTRVQWSTSSETGPWTDISAYDSDFTIATNVAVDDSVNFWFRIQTPTGSSSYNQYSSTLTVTGQ